MGAPGPVAVATVRNPHDVVEQTVYTVDASGMITLGGGGKVEVVRERLADDTFRLTLRGEASVLAGLGIGGSALGRGAELGGTVYGGGQAEVSWDVATARDMDRIQVRLLMTPGAIGPVGVGLPSCSGPASRFAAGPYALPDPTSWNVGSQAGGTVSGLAASYLGGGAVNGDLRATATVDGAGTRREELKLTSDVQGELGPGVNGLLATTATLAVAVTTPRGKLLPTSATFTLSSDTGKGGTVGFAQGTTRTRTDLVWTLDEEKLRSAKGQELLAAARRGDDAEVRRLLEGMTKPAVRTWEGEQARARLDVDVEELVKVEVKSGVQGTHWRETTPRP